MEPIAVSNNLVLYETDESEGLGFVEDIFSGDTTEEKSIVSLLSLSNDWKPYTLDEMLNKLLDDFFIEHEYVENQAVATPTRPTELASRSTSSSAPGPPPRPGLTWKPQTHRWIRPGQSEESAPRGKPGEQWWMPEQEGDDRPILTVDSQRIPPAWTDLWVNHDSNADRLAVGFDSKGRSQTLYSHEYGKRRKAGKFGRIRAFHQVHDTLVKQIDKDVLANNETAIVASLINLSYIRPGSEKDTGAKTKAYGATTLLSDHIKINGDEITLDFPSKKGGHTVRKFENKALAKILKQRLQARQPGAQMFDTDETKVNDYIHKTTVDLGLPGAENIKFTNKDFRTLGGTKIAIAEMASGRHTMRPPPTAEHCQKRITAANKKRAVPPAIPEKKGKIKGKLWTDAQFKKKIADAKVKRAKWKQQPPLDNAGMEKVIKKEFESSLNKAKLPVGEIVSEQLQNAASEAVKSYIDPHVFEDWNATYEDTQRRVISQLLGR